MDSAADADAQMLATIAARAEAMDIAALEDLVPAAQAWPEPVRTALAEALAGCLGQIEMDVAADKFPALDGFAEAAAGFALCRQLVPDDPGYALGELRALLALAAEDGRSERDAAADLEAALGLATALISGWEGQRPRGPEETELHGNWVTVRGARLDDAFAARAECRLLQAGRRPAALAEPLAAAAGDDYEAACARHLSGGHLASWWYGIDRLERGPDPGHGACAAAARRRFDAYAAARIASHPADAWHWGELFTRRADQPAEHGGSAALARAAALWRDYACDPGLPPWRAVQVGHWIQWCGRRLADAGLLRRALAIYEDALQREPDNFRSGYAADACRDLAGLPGVAAAERRAWFDRAVDLCRRFAMPEDDFHFAMHFSELLLDRAAGFGFPPEHPDLEEAWRRSDRLIASHGAAHLLPSEHAARARLLQRREREAAEILRAGLARIGCVTAAEIAARPWFQALEPAPAARLRQALKASGVPG